MIIAGLNYQNVTIHDTTPRKGLLITSSPFLFKTLSSTLRGISLTWSHIPEGGASRFI
jgi:hypothetical protein